MKVGDRVRIVEDEFPNLVGKVGTIKRIGPDGTTAWVETFPPHGLWCCIAALDVVE